MVVDLPTVDVIKVLVGEDFLAVPSRRMNTLSMVP